MAFVKVNNSNETSQIKRYIGVTPAKIVAVNPSKKELEDIYGREFDKEPSYITDNNGVTQVRLDFVFSFTVDDSPIYVRKAFYISNEPHIGANSKKYEIIDKYGQTAWGTVEDLKDHKIPMYANGPANISLEYRPAYVGEVNVEKLIRALLCLNNPTYFNNNTGKVERRNGADLEQCEGLLDNSQIKELFSGNFSSIKETINLGKDNEVKVMIGLKHSDDNKMYYDIFGDLFVKNTRKIDSACTDFAKELKSRKEAGAYSNVEFDCSPIHEYVVEPTTFAVPVSAPAAPASAFPFSMDDMPNF